MAIPVETSTYTRTCFNMHTYMHACIHDSDIFGLWRPRIEPAFTASQRKRSQTNNAPAKPDACTVRLQWLVLQLILVRVAIAWSNADGNHCSHTYEGLLLMQLCNHKPKMQCSRFQGNMHTLLLCAAVQTQADSSLVPLQLHLSSFCPLHKCANTKPEVLGSRGVGKVHALLLSACAAQHQRAARHAIRPEPHCSAFVFGGYRTV